MQILVNLVGFDNSGMAVAVCLRNYTENERSAVCWHLCSCRPLHPEAVCRILCSMAYYHSLKIFYSVTPFYDDNAIIAHIPGKCNLYVRKSADVPSYMHRHICPVADIFCNDKCL